MMLLKNEKSANQQFMDFQVSPDGPRTAFCIFRGKLKIVMTKSDILNTILIRSIFKRVDGFDAHVDMNWGRWTSNGKFRNRTMVPRIVNFPNWAPSKWTVLGFLVDFL